MVKNTPNNMSTRYFSSNFVEVSRVGDFHSQRQGGCSRVHKKSVGPSLHCAWGPPAVRGRREEGHGGGSGSSLSQIWLYLTDSLINSLNDCHCYVLQSQTMTCQNLDSGSFVSHCLFGCSWTKEPVEQPQISPVKLAEKRVATIIPNFSGKIT